MYSNVPLTLDALCIISRDRVAPSKNSFSTRLAKPKSRTFAAEEDKAPHLPQTRCYKNGTAVRFFLALLGSLIWCFYSGFRSRVADILRVIGAKMKKQRRLAFQFVFLLVAQALASVPWAQASAAANAQPPTWVELGENGTIIARQVLEVSDTGLPPACPAIQIKGVPNPPTQTQERGNRPENFKALVCEAVIPSGATSASIGGVQLPLPKATITKIVLVGDTGCKGDASGRGMKVTPLDEPEEEEEASPSGKSKQNCLSRSDWPLSTIAKHAAAQQPDLVVHVGDYVYVKEKGWTQWRYQFFEPARKLLLAAPWIFVRGNHETCGDRHGAAFFYLLDPRKDTSCASADDHSAPYLAKAGGSQFVVMDSSGADCDFSPGEPDGCKDKDYQSEVTVWTGLFVKAKTLVGSGEAFLLTHRPLWGIKPAKSSEPPPQGYCQANAGRTLVAINSSMQAAYQKAGMTGIKMVLSGHIHNFQLVTYQKQNSGIDPLPQLVVGDSGVELSTPPPPIMSDCKVTAQNGFLALSTFQGMDQFGFGVVNSNATKFALYLRNGDRGLKCTIARHGAKCMAEIVPSKH